MNQEFSGNTWVELSEKALVNNIQIFKNIHNSINLATVVKSNAYGHGMLPVARICLDQGINFLAVNSTDEYHTLTRYFSKEVHHPNSSYQILIMGDPGNPDPNGDYSRAIFVAGNLDVLDRLSKLKNIEKSVEKNVVKKIQIHLKVDTGLSRLGFTEKELSVLGDYLQKNDQKFNLTGVMSHFANVEDVTDPGYMLEQIKAFNKLDDICQTCNKDKSIPLMRHISSSASTILYPATHYDLARIGISLYGFWPSPLTKLSAHSIFKNILPLQPVLTWKTKIVHLKDVAKDKPIGYGCSFLANNDMRVAVIPVGYYEGYDRGLSNSGSVLVEGRRCSIVGRVCMNMSIIDVTHLSEVKMGATVVLIGKQGDNHISADRIAELTDTINYEVVTRINSEIPRIVVC